MAINTYAKIMNGKAVSLQNMEEDHIGGFKGVWVEAQNGFGIGDLYDEINGWSHLTKTTQEIEDEARAWRDNELKVTDFIVPTTDYPNHAAWLTYRQELRDWTATSDFPDTKPVAPAELN